MVKELNEDDLRKLGLRVRTRSTSRNTAVNAKAPGRIAFDDLGNAVYAWNDESLAGDDEAAERARRKALSHPGLAITDDDPDPNATIRPNPQGLRVGYNPYESGMLAHKARKPKRDLREFSKWIEMKKKAGGR